jgi:hypothetical protein
MRHWIKALIVAVLFAPVLVRAQTHVEVGVGINRFFDHGDGTWYQYALPHKVHEITPSLLIGVTGDITPHWAWHLDAIDLGRASANSLDVMDANYDPIHHQCLAHCTQLTRFISDGTLWGIAPMLEWHTTGSWRVGLQAGPWIFHQNWSVVIPNFYSSTGYPQANGWAPWSSNGDAIYHSAHMWGLGAVAGVGLQHGPYGVHLLGFYNNKNFGLGTDPWPPLWRTEADLMVTYTFQP